jgi:putative holliday junction resolvase
MRTLGIDYGERRVGLALSDEGGKLATPLEVVTVSAPEQAAERCVVVCREEGVRRIVLGLPLNMDGSVGAGARKVIAWGRELAGRAGVELVFVDERLSSFAAEQELIERKRAGEKITRGGKKKRLDAIVAAGLLQGFLDGGLAAVDVGKVS